jgi:hypothetical protein
MQGVWTLNIEFYKEADIMAHIPYIMGNNVKTAALISSAYVISKKILAKYYEQFGKAQEFALVHAGQYIEFKDGKSIATLPVSYISNYTGELKKYDCVIIIIDGLYEEVLEQAVQLGSDALRNGWNSFQTDKKGEKTNPYPGMQNDWYAWDKGWNLAREIFLERDLQLRGFLIELDKLKEKYNVTYLGTGCGCCGAGGVITDKDGNDFEFSL